MESEKFGAELKDISEQITDKVEEVIQEETDASILELIKDVNESVYLNRWQRRAWMKKLRRPGDGSPEFKAHRARMKRQAKKGK